MMSRSATRATSHTCSALIRAPSSRSAATAVAQHSAAEELSPAPAGSDAVIDASTGGTAKPFWRKASSVADGRSCAVRDAPPGDSETVTPRCTAVHTTTPSA